MKKGMWAFYLVVIFTAIFFMSDSEAADLSGLAGIASLSFSLGSIGNKDDTIKSRSIDVLDARLFPGWRLSDMIMIGAMGQYRLVGQLEDPNSVSGTNVAGKGYYLGAGAAVSISMFVFQGSFDFLGSESLSNNTANGQSVSYSQPTGFTVVAGYKFMPFFTVDGVFGTHDFKHQTIAGSTELDISSNKLTETHYGLGLSFVY